MPTPSETGYRGQGYGYSSPFGPPQHYGGGQNAAMFNMLGYRGASGLNQFMQGRGYRQLSDGSFRGQTMAGTPKTMSQDSAGVLAQMLGPKWSQAGNAAIADFAQLQGIIGEQNQRTDQLWNTQMGQMQANLGRGMGEADQIRATAAGEADKLEQMGQDNWDEFESMRERMLGKADAQAATFDKRLKGIEDAMNKDNVEARSAMVTGMGAQAAQEADQIRSQMLAQGMSPGEADAAAQQYKQGAQNQMWQQNAQWNQQYNQFMTGVRTQLAGLKQGSDAQTLGAYGQALGETNVALNQRAQLQGASAEMRRAGELDAARTQMAYEQVALGWGQQAADTLRTLPKRYASLSNLLLQVGWSDRQFGTYNFGVGQRAAGMGLA